MFASLAYAEETIHAHDTGHLRPRHRPCNRRSPPSAQILLRPERRRQRVLECEQRVRRDPFSHRSDSREHIGEVHACAIRIRESRPGLRRHARERLRQYGPRSRCSDRTCRELAGAVLSPAPSAAQARAGRRSNRHTSGCRRSAVRVDRLRHGRERTRHRLLGRGRTAQGVSELLGEWHSRELEEPVQTAWR
jgi:hypothetical protein